jgi:sterol desaturase/sphingolipid hydroxylase (fatty acid hydroxylase superfamily)
MNNWLYAIVGLLLLDFIGAYLVHLVEHKVKFLWRFHLIHHTDTWIDTTTANRHHPGESVLRFIFTTLGVFIVGSPMWMVFLYQSLSVLATQFNHANIVLPKRLDNILSYIIVSQICIKYIIITSYLIQIVIMEIFFLFGIDFLVHIVR